MDGERRDFHRLPAPHAGAGRGKNQGAVTVNTTGSAVGENAFRPFQTGRRGTSPALWEKADFPWETRRMMAKTKTLRNIFLIKYKTDRNLAKTGRLS
jgi:hypothetical protein